MATNNKSRINGIIDTSNNVLANIDQIATSGSCFLTWDPSLGQWSVILNTTGSSTKSFDDDNIIGEISLSGSGVNEMYNSVQVTFPNRDTRDTTDVIVLNIATADRFPQELDNQLQIELPTVNDPTQAKFIASRELKQSRLDKIIEFRANFEANALRAGDLIDVTNNALDFTNKLFRVIQVDEEDTDDGNLIFSVIAQEYDANIFTDTGLTYEYRSNFTGIKSKVFNTDIDAKDDFAFGNQMGRLLAANLGLGLLRSFLTSDEGTETNQQELKFADDATQELMEAGAKIPSLTHDEPADTTICSGTPITLTAQHDCEVCFINTPDYTYNYSISGCTASEVNIPLSGTVKSIGNSASLSFTPTVTEQKTIQVNLGDNSTSYDVSPAPTKYAASITASSTSITEGDTVTSVDITTVGIDDADTINYAITGSASGKVSSPALTGTVTITSNAGSLGSIVTTDNSTYNEDEDLVVTFTYTGEPTDYCGVSSNSVTIQVANNDTTGPIPPSVSKPGDFECDYVSVPVIWCGTFDADTQYLKSIAVKKYALLPRAPVGGTAVPTAISVTNPGESSAALSIDSTVNIDNVTGAGGAQIDVITSFDPLPSGGDTLLTGTVSTFTGYWD
jgi:hypothetical protein